MSCYTKLKTSYQLAKTSKLVHSLATSILLIVGTVSAVPTVSAHTIASFHQHSLVPDQAENNSAGPFSVSRDQLLNNVRYYRGSVLSYQNAPPMTVVPPIKKPKPRRNDFVKDELLLTYDFGMDVEAVKAITKKYKLKRKGGMAIKSLRKGVIIADTQGQSPLDLKDLINKAEKSFAAITNTYYTPATRSFRLDYPLAQTGLGRARTIARGKGILI